MSPGACVCLPCAMRVAFVGNSYTYYNELPTMLATLASLTPARVNMHHASVTPGGSSLADHADGSKASGAATAAMLAQPPGWDFVVLQDQSQAPGGGMDGDSGAGVGEAAGAGVGAALALVALVAGVAADVLEQARPPTPAQPNSSLPACMHRAPGF